jgi:hypothetical protein
VGNLVETSIERPKIKAFSHCAQNLSVLKSKVFSDIWKNKGQVRHGLLESLRHGYGNSTG